MARAAKNALWTTARQKIAPQRSGLPKIALQISAALLVALLAASGCTTLDQWQRRAIFQHDAGWARGGSARDFATEEFDLAVAPGQQVHAWFLAADGHVAPGAPAAPTLLYLHGARRDLDGNRARVAHLQQLGYNVLAIDYRGFGRSTALLPSEASALVDARAAWAELKRREPDPSRRFVYGYSLGGAMAIALAAEEDGLAGVIVESSFTSIAEVVRHTRWGWVPGIRWLVTQPFDSRARIGLVNEPLLLIHGTEDGLVPHTMSDELLAAARAVPAQHKRLLKVAGARHASVIWRGGDAYAEALHDFVTLARSVAKASTPAAGQAVPASLESAPTAAGAATGAATGAASRPAL